MLPWHLWVFFNLPLSKQKTVGKKVKGCLNMGKFGDLSFLKYQTFLIEPTHEMYLNLLKNIEEIISFLLNRHMRCI